MLSSSLYHQCDLLLLTIKKSLVLSLLVKKLSLLAVMHDRARLRALLIYIILTLRQSSVMCGIVKSYFRFFTVKHHSFCSFNSEGQHRKWMHKFLGQIETAGFPKAKEEMNVPEMTKKWVHAHKLGQIPRTNRLNSLQKVHTRPEVALKLLLTCPSKMVAWEHSDTNK